MSVQTTGSRTSIRPQVRFPALVAFGGLLLRDIRVLTKEPVRFIIRTVSQPLMLVFVFTYVLPMIGRQPFGALEGGQSFTDVLVPGVIAITTFMKGIQAVALPLVDEFGYTREIDDRVMAPLPVWAVAIGKIMMGAIQGILAMAVVFPIIALVPAEPIEVNLIWYHFIAIGILGPIAGATFGLVLGTMFEPKQVPLMFSIVILPITFLGATYYPWSALSALPWLQTLSVINPLVFVAEGFRMAMTPQFEHMPTIAIYSALVGVTCLMTVISIWGFRRRVLA